jgi:hypothetical protein
MYIDWITDMDVEFQFHFWTDLLMYQNIDVHRCAHFRSNESRVRYVSRRVGGLP